MFNCDYVTNENIKKHNPNWTEIPDHPYRILTIRGSRSGKTNALLNLINNEPDIDRIYLYAEDRYEEKYQLLINRRENPDLKYFNDSNLLLNIQMIWMTFIKILKNAIQIKNEKYC